MSQRKKIVLLFTALLLVAAASVFHFVRSHRSKQTAVTQADSVVSEFSESPGIILSDHVKGVADPTQADSPPVREFHTGDILTAVTRKQGWLLVGEKTWVREKDLLIPSEIGMLETFVSGSSRLSEHYPAGAVEHEWTVLDSEGFLKRCARNPFAESAAPCVRRLLRFRPRDEIVTEWLELLKAGVANEALDNEVSFLLSTGPSPSDVSTFEKGYIALSPDERVELFTKTCASVAISGKIFAKVLNLVAKEDEKVFEGFVGCVTGTVIPRMETFAVAYGMVKAATTNKKLLSYERRRRLK